MITIKHNEDLIYHVKEYDVVLVGTTINNALGNGFQKEVERSFRYVSDRNKATVYGDNKKLGQCLVVMGEPIFCLCYIFKMRNLPSKKPDVLDYDALENCLTLINDEFAGKNIATTVIGASEYDGGGDPKKVLEIIKKALTDVNVTIYDYQQPNYREEDKKIFKDIVNRRKKGEITSEEYQELKKKYIWEQYHGFYDEMPKNLTYNELKDYINNEKRERGLN